MHSFLPLDALHFDPTDISILIVEDSTFINTLLSDTLNNYGYITTTSFTLKEAKIALGQREFDYVILDIYLPDGDGITLLEERILPDFTKTIITTTDKDKQVREHLFNLGILDYFIKDDNFIHSIALIHKLIEKTEQNYLDHILLIDDSRLVCKQISTFLQPRNYQIHIANNAKDALQIMENQKINLIILDLYLPDLNGDQFLSKLKRNPDYTEIPVIMLSGTEDQNIISKVLKGGASDFLHKPLIIEQFLLKADLWIDYIRKSNRLEQSKRLLTEYKEIVDHSAMIIKTDMRGDIIYTNSHFYRISGYRSDELIGKNISYIRDEDEQAFNFKELKYQRTKHITAKNRTKIGELYYVESHIHPILDNNRNLLEVIILEHDISDMIRVKEHLKEQLQIRSHNFKEAFSLSKTYEDAINSSTIVSRFNHKGELTYVNEALCQISGYREEELLGQPFAILLDQNCIDMHLTKLNHALSHGKTFKETLTNKNKQGESFFINTTISPIKDSEDAIIEFISISHDVSRVISLQSEVQETQSEVLERLGSVAEERSQETGDHVRRVAHYSKFIAEKLGLNEEEVNLLYLASPMHDIGKISIPDKILNKPGKLSLSEWETMKKHPETGEKIFASSTRPLLQAAATISLTHHEKYDGTGYPHGLKGEEIHIFGRITAVADVFDALGSKRPYKEAWELKEILAYFKEQSGAHFDPNCVKILFENIHHFLEIKSTFPTD
jgi:PAS domain S-box-containing protein